MGAVVAGNNATIAAPYVGADAGREILRRGGNAVDAAVAAMLACCVGLPGSVGIGGYGGSVVAYLAKKRKVIAVDFDSRAPLAYRAEDYGGDRKKYDLGYLSITVPAVVAGLDVTLTRYGTMPWSAVSEAAIELAERGVRVTVNLKRQLDDWVKKADPISRRALFPNGPVPEVGKDWVQRDLAKLLRRLAEEGPGALYLGEIPRMIAKQVQDNGGILTEEDFARYRPQIVEPLAMDYRGYRVLTPPPPSGGLTSLQILNTLEQFELSAMQPWSAEYFHLFAEAAKLSWQDRERCLGDPDVTPIPFARLLSKESAKENAARIRREGVLRNNGTTAPSPPHTVNVLTADSDGNVVSLTATHGYLYGSQVAIEHLGLVMGHGMSRFSLTDGSPNAPEAGKRMFHNMSPMVLLRDDGRACAAVGLPGGPKIVTVTAQLVVSLIDFKVSPAFAVRAGRIHVEADEPVAVSSAVSDGVVEELRRLGHTVRRGQDSGGPPNEIGGPANAIMIDAKTGDASAATQADG